MRSRNERRDGSTGSTKFDSSVGLSSENFHKYPDVLFFIYQDHVY
jgi:hypothetical protein